jgi:hypothetical protein
MNNTEEDFYENKLFIVEHNAQLLYDSPLFQQNQNQAIRQQVRRVRLIYPNRTCLIYLDERFNDLEIRPQTSHFRGFDNKNDDVIDYLIDKYQELKNSDFRYKRGDGYEGDKSIYLEDFIEYLKIQNRDKTIEKILEN